jgi:hypothetical protein
LDQDIQAKEKKKRRKIDKVLRSRPVPHMSPKATEAKGRLRETIARFGEQHRSVGHGTDITAGELSQTIGSACLINLLTASTVFVLRRLA